MVDKRPWSEITYSALAGLSSLTTSSLQKIVDGLNSHDDEVRYTASNLCWALYPMLRIRCIGRLKQYREDEDIAAIVDDLEAVLNISHEKATAILKKAAESSDLNSVVISIAARHCREFLVINPNKYFSANRKSDIFPDCLGDSLYELPSDIRQAFLGAHEELNKLWVERQGQRGPLRPWTQAAEIEARRLVGDGKVTSGSALQESLAINRQVALELYRHITGKPKKGHDMN